MAAYKRISPQPVVEGGTGATTLTGVLIGNGTSAITASTVTQHDVLVGAASNAITSVAPSATSGVPLISQGASSDPAFGTAVVAGGGTGATTLTAHGVLLGEGTSAIVATAVGTNGQILVGASAADPGWVTPTAGTGLSVTANSTTHSYALSTPVTVSNGGTGDTSLTAYAVLCGGTTSTGAIQSVASVGSSGNVLTSNGAGALPTFQAAGTGLSSVSITLTNAQVKALHATPIQVVAAPGSGKLLLPFMFQVQLNYGGNNAFTNTGNGRMSLFYNNTSGPLGAIDIPAPFVTQTASQIFFAAGESISNNLGASFAASSTFTNQALVISQDSATEFAGNAANDNTIDLTVWYMTVTP